MNANKLGINYSTRLCQCQIELDHALPFVILRYSIRSLKTTLKPRLIFHPHRRFHQRCKRYQPLHTRLQKRGTLITTTLEVPRPNSAQSLRFPRTTTFETVSNCLRGLDVVAFCCAILDLINTDVVLDTSFPAYICVLLLKFSMYPP